jgi:integrase
MKKAGGKPLFLPTVYTIAIQRSSGKSSATLAGNLRSIMHLYTWAYSSGMDINERFSDYALLNIPEIESLVTASGLTYDQLCKHGETSPKANIPGVKNGIYPMERYRRFAHTQICTVDNKTKLIRLLYIRDYLDWLAQQQMPKISPQSKNHSLFKTSRVQMKEAIEARLPASKGRNIKGDREGLEPEIQKRLTDVIHPHSPENSWKNPHVRVRNRLFILMMLVLGVRKGELLLTRIKDVNFQSNELLIRRVPDDPDYPRFHEPNTKTRDRILPFEDDLAALIEEYILKARNKAPGAGRHDFLFTATGTWQPLSLAGVTKVFMTLRSKISDLPDNLTSHVLRHTWNERFPEMMDQNNVSEAEEKKLRSYLMGWSEFSGMAGTYTKRYVRKKANEASLDLQKKIMKKE